MICITLQLLCRQASHQQPAKRLVCAPGYIHPPKLYEIATNQQRRMGAHGVVGTTQYIRNPLNFALPAAPRWLAEGISSQALYTIDLA